MRFTHKEIIVPLSNPYWIEDNNGKATYVTTAVRRYKRSFKNQQVLRALYEMFPSKVNGINRLLTTDKIKRLLSGYYNIHENNKNIHKLMVELNFKHEHCGPEKEVYCYNVSHKEMKKVYGRFRAHKL